MAEKEILAALFETNRGQLRSIAYRMLGSRTEADDAVQEAFLRLMRAGTTGVDNLAGWLTTVVARICLDMLRKRQSRREVPVDIDVESVPAADNLEREKIVADSVGAAMLVVLETLTPAERIAFVLHDMFGVSFDDIARVIGRSTTAARQLASRARQRVRGAPAEPETDRARRSDVVIAFLAAARSGDLTALIAILDPGVVLRADAAAVEARMGRASGDGPALAPEIRGHESVANLFRGRAKAAQLAVVDGDVGLVFATGGRTRMVIDFVIEKDRIVEIGLIADPERVAAFAVEFWGERASRTERASPGPNEKGGP